MFVLLSQAQTALLVLDIIIKTVVAKNLRIQVFNGNEQVCSPAMRTSGTIQSHPHYWLLFRSWLSDG